MHRSKRQLFDHVVGGYERQRASLQPLVTIPPPRDSTFDRRWQCFEAECLRGLQVRAWFTLRGVRATSTGRANWSALHIDTPNAPSAGRLSKRSHIDWMADYEILIVGSA